MSTFATWLELHQTTAGWSTVVMVAWVVAAVIVGKKIMLGSTYDSWIQHHIIAVGIGATLLGVGVLAGAMYLSHALFGVAWPGIPFGALLMLVVAFSAGRTVRPGRNTPEA